MDDGPNIIAFIPALRTEMAKCLASSGCKCSYIFTFQRIIDKHGKLFSGGGGRAFIAHLHNIQNQKRLQLLHVIIISSITLSNI